MASEWLRQIYEMGIYGHLWASMGRGPDLVELLLKYGAGPMADNNTAIYWASMSQGPNVELSLKHGADAAANDNCYLEQLSSRGRADAVKLPLENGADPASNNTIIRRLYSTI